MLSSLISEKTVKEGAAFSHTLSSFHSVVRLSMSIRRSLGRTRQSRKWHSPSRSLPLLLSSHLLSPVFIIFLASHLLPAIMLTRTCPPLPLLFLFYSSNISIHRLPHPPSFYVQQKLFNQTINIQYLLCVNNPVVHIP